LYIDLSNIRHGSTCTDIISAINLIIRDVGLLKRNALQCLHTVYNLTQQYNSGEWNDVWMVLTGVKYEAMKMPVMGRWECVGDSVDHVLK